MPQRQRIATITSVDVQGADSWVRVAQLTVGEWKALQKAGEPKLIKKGRNGAPDEYEEADMWALEAKALADHIVGWNWVNDDGTPMKLPTPDDYECLNEMTRAETTFLVNALVGNMPPEDLKNSDSN